MGGVNLSTAVLALKKQVTQAGQALSKVSVSLKELWHHVASTQNTKEPEPHLRTSQRTDPTPKVRAVGSGGLQKDFEQLSEQLPRSDGAVKSRLRKIASEGNTALVLIKRLSALADENLCSFAVKITRPDSSLRIFLRPSCGTRLRTNLSWLQFM